MILKTKSHIITAGCLILILNLWLEFFLVPGTYFMLDTLFYPFTQWRDFYSTSIYFYFIDVLKYVFWYALASKIFLIFIYIVTFWVWVFLSRFLQGNNLWGEKHGKYLDILCMLLVIYTPFFAQRFITQSGIALGGSLLLLGTLATLSLSRNAWGKWALLTAGVSYGVAFAIFPHTLFLLLLLFVLFASIYPRNILKFLNIWFIILLLNANWIYGEIFWQAQRVWQHIESFNEQNIQAFTSGTISQWPVELSHLLGYGFWVEKYHIASPDDLISWWGVIALCILWVMILWIIKLLRTREYRLLLFLTTLWLISYILSLWISSEYTKDLAWWMYQHIPWYIGMREPQKWMALMMISYIFFFTQWSRYILENLPQRFVIIGGKIFLLFIALFWSVQSLFAYAQHLRITDYPADTWEVREFLLSSKSVGETIVFPWHSYVACSWTRSIVTSNPIEYLMHPVNVTVSDNIEIAWLYSNSRSEFSAQVERYLREKDTFLLKDIWVKKILFMNWCADYKNYDFLEDDNLFQKKYESNNFKVYELK